jgi:hypothetical protein
MATTNLLQASQLVTTRFWRVLFLAMLVVLHLSAMRGAGDPWARALMLAHFGLFIIWQPFMRGAQRLTAGQTIGTLAISVAILFFLNWWLLALWVSVFTGIVGGKVFLFQARWLRRFYLVVVFYLIALLLLWIVPNTFLEQGLPPEIQMLAQYGLPVLFLVMAVMPAEPDSSETPQIVDLFYATLIRVHARGQRALCAGAHLQPARPGRRPAAAVAGLESARRFSRPVDVFLALPAVDRAAI